MKNQITFEGGFGHKSMKHYHGNDSKKSKVFISLCQNYKSKDQSGQEIEKQNWQSFTGFGLIADAIAREKPGIMIVDAILTNSEDKDGKQRSEMIITNYTMKRLPEGAKNE
jgi:hypothetical protein